MFINNVLDPPWRQSTKWGPGALCHLRLIPLLSGLDAPAQPSGRKELISASHAGTAVAITVIQVLNESEGGKRQKPYQIKSKSSVHAAYVQCLHGTQ